MARKLHEYLGSQRQVFTQAEAVRKDLTNTFEKKGQHFRETIKSYTPDAEDAKTVTEAQSLIQSTVRKELAWITPILAKAIDSEATIDEGNMKARGDVRLDNGTVLLSNVPATQLLQLDKRLGELHQFVSQIPTLDPVKGFKPDPAKGEGISVALTRTVRRTSKEEIPLVLHPPTDKHPAQVKSIVKDIEIGTIVEQEWSGLITPGVKAEMLERVEELRRAVKQARARANDLQVEEVQIGKQLLSYVFEPAYK